MKRLARVVVYDLRDRHVPYVEAWRWQRQLQKEAIDRASEDRPREDAMLLLEHESVYTLGKGSKLEHVTFLQRGAGGAAPKPVVAPAASGGLRTRDGSLLVRVERGGEVTWHGPGQLVAYPILDLGRRPDAGPHAGPPPRDLRAYVRAVEDVAIGAAARLGVDGCARDGEHPGVWLARDKICAVGVAVSRWVSMRGLRAASGMKLRPPPPQVSMHGFALNVCPDLERFARIVPCGIAPDAAPGAPARGVTSVRRELASRGAAGAAAAVDVDAARVAVLEEFGRVFDAELDVRRELPPELEACGRDESVQPYDIARGGRG